MIRLAAISIGCLCGVIAGVLPGVAQTSLPPDLRGTIQQAQILLGQQQFEKAERLMLEATKAHASEPASWYFLGYTCHAQKKYDEALGHYQNANELAQGKGPNILYNMACIHAVKNERDQAFEFLDKAIQAGYKNLSHLHSDAELANLKSDKRFQKYRIPWLDDSELFVEKSRIIHKWVGENAGDQFGWTARRAGDIDKDGVTDFVATAPTFANGAGKIYVYSSKSGELLFSKQGQPGDRLGNSAVGIGDIDGDGVSDVIAGAPNASGKGAVRCYSGKNGKVIHHLKGVTEGGQFGYEVSALPDLDGDSVPDILVGEMAGNGVQAKSGRVIAYSGKSGDQLFELKGKRTGDGYGNAASSISAKDGEVLLAVGANNSGPSQRGCVYVYSISKSTMKEGQENRVSIPKLKFKIEGDQNSVNLGQMFISFPGDLDRDGVPDVYASDFSDKTKVGGGGKVVVHSGSDGRELLSIHGAVKGEGLGTSPSDAGDVDGDGIGDLVIGAWQNSDGSAGGGKVYLYSCANQGKLLRSWTCKQSGDTLGFDACGIGDVDGDGFTDFLLTSAWSAKHGPKTGRVFIVAGENFADRAVDPDRKPLRAGNVSTLLDGIEAGTGGLNVDTSGRLYTADFGGRLDGKGVGGHRIYRVSPSDGAAELFCTKLRGGSGNTFDSQGNLFQSSIGGHFISKITPDGEVEVVCKSGLASPVGLAFNRRGELLVCNCGNNTIGKVLPDGTATTFCDSSLLKCPNGITVGPDGMIYVCNFGNGDVIQIDPKGAATKLATLPGANNGHLIYHRGFLYVLARKDSRVYQVDLGGRVEVFAGSGQRGNTDGAALESSFSLPNSLVVSPDGKWMYINETSPVSGDHRILTPTRIRKIELLGR